MRSPQPVPFHSHVSPDCDVWSKPPNNTIRARAAPVRCQQVDRVDAVAGLGREIVDRTDRNALRVFQVHGIEVEARVRPEGEAEQAEADGRRKDERLRARSRADMRKG